MAVKPIIWSTTSPAISELHKGIDEVIGCGCQGLLIFSGIENNYNDVEINQLLTQLPLPVAGGMFAEIILQHQHAQHGAIIIGLGFAPVIANYTQLSMREKSLEQYIQQQSLPIEDYQHFIVIADAFCSRGESFIEMFYDFMGSGCTVIGGGAGGLNFLPRPSIFTNAGVVEDAMQVMAIPHSIHSSVSHGWEVLDGPYLVTESEGNRVKALNYSPAFDVYRDAIFNASGNSIDRDNFFDIAQNYPLGITGIGDELLVRDPIKSIQHDLVCVGHVPVNSMVYLLKGEAEKLITSAGRSAKALHSNAAPETLLLFDCISRGLFLGNEFHQELSAIEQHADEAQLIGVLSLGEVANSRSGAICLLNKSTVIGSI